MIPSDRLQLSPEENAHVTYRTVVEGIETIKAEMLEGVRSIDGVLGSRSSSAGPREKHRRPRIRGKARRASSVSPVSSTLEPSTCSTSPALGNEEPRAVLGDMRASCATTSEDCAVTAARQLPRPAHALTPRRQGAADENASPNVLYSAPRWMVEYLEYSAEKQPMRPRRPSAKTAKPPPVARRTSQR